MRVINIGNVLDLIRTGEGLTMAQIADGLGAVKIAAREDVCEAVAGLCKRGEIGLWRRDLGKRCEYVYKVRT